MSAKVPHIPSRDDRERTTGHAYHYSREDRYALANAPQEPKKPGFRRYTILFLDILILLIGVTVIRKCMVNRTPEPATGTGTRTAAGVTSGPWRARASVDATAGDILEYRLSIKRLDGTLFSVDTNAMRVTLACTEDGTNRFTGLGIIAPEAKLISHQFHVAFPKARAARFSAVRFRWQTAPGETRELPLPATAPDK